MENVTKLDEKHSHLMYYIKLGLELHEKIAIGSNDVDKLHDTVQAIFPYAKLTKEDGFLFVEDEE